MKLNKGIPPETLMSIASIEDTSRLADTLVARLNIKLEGDSSSEGRNPLSGSRSGENSSQERDRDSAGREEDQAPSAQANGEEPERGLPERADGSSWRTGERDEFKSEIAEIEARIAEKELSEEAKEKLQKELRKLKLMSPMSAEAAVVRNYVDTVLSLPWYNYSAEVLDIAHALRVLEQDRTDKKVKEKILEYIAISSCGPHAGAHLVSGRTSRRWQDLAGTIGARATNREFVRLSLGGVRDGSEIRGHRRTYIGYCRAAHCWSQKPARATRLCSWTKSTRCHRMCVEALQCTPRGARP